MSKPYLLVSLKLDKKLCLFYTLFQVLTEKNLKETILAHQKERENYLKEVCGVLYILLMNLKISFSLQRHNIFFNINLRRMYKVFLTV